MERPRTQQSKPQSVKSEATLRSFKGFEVVERPRMVKYQVRKGNAGLGGRLIRVQDVPVPMQEEEDDIMSVKPLSIPQSRPSTQDGARKHSVKNISRSQMSLLRSPKQQDTTTGMFRSSSPQKQFNMADLSRFRRPMRLSINEVREPTQVNAEQQTVSKDQEPCTQEINFIDQIPLDDPIWKTVIPEEMFQNPNINLQKTIQDNFEYFQHQLGLCCCFRCICGQCRCEYAKNVKLNFQSSNSSIYGKDFRLKSNQFNLISPLNVTKYDTKFNDQQTIELQSQHRVSFKPFMVKLQERQKPEPIVKSAEFSGMTSYKAEFNNWGESKAMFFKRPPHVSTSDTLPFYGQSLYQNSFCHGEKGEPAALLKTQTQLSNSNWIITGRQKLKLDHLSDIQDSPQGHYRVDGSKIQTQYQQEYVPKPSYSGQYVSLQSRDYRGQNNQMCPGKEFKRVLSKKLLSKQQQ